MPRLSFNSVAIMDYGFRQVTHFANRLLFEITPTHVNIPTALRVGGYTAGMRPFVSCAVKLDGTRYWTRGQQTATTVRNGLGDYTVSWGTAHPDGVEHVPQYCLINFWGFIFSGTRTATSIQIKVTDSVGGGLDRDFFFTLH